MNSEASASKLWPFPVAIIASIGIFAATFFACAERQRLHEGGAYSPVVVGVSAFALAMIIMAVVVLPKERRRVWRVLAMAAGLTAVFTYALMFLLLNIYGS